YRKVSTTTVWLSNTDTTLNLIPGQSSVMIRTISTKKDTVITTLKVPMRAMVLTLPVSLLQTGRTTLVSGVSPTTCASCLYALSRMVTSVTRMSPTQSFMQLTTARISST